MKVLRLHGVSDMRLHEESRPTVTQGEALIRVSAIGICASDLHWFNEGGIGDARLSHPLILGHEFSGIIEQDETNTFTSGTHVAVDPSITCGSCEFCLSGNPNFCVDLKFAGHGLVDGAMREYISWPSRFCYPLPDAFTGIDGAMLEPLGVGIHSIDLGHIKPGMVVAVLGCGPIGLFTLQMARLAGAVKIIATDRLTHRLQAARELGADVIIQSENGLENPEIIAEAGRYGVDVAFEAAGENQAVETAIDVVRPGGRVVLIGIPSVDRTEFTASTARRKGITIALVRRMKNTYPRAIRLVEGIKVDIKTVVTHCFPMVDHQQAFSVALNRQGIKVVIET